VSVTPGVFDAHLDFLQHNQFTVWPLGRVLQTLASGQPVPDNTMAITFDDAGISVYEEVLPRMKARGWPFTLFVSTEAVNRGYRTNMNWQQIAEIAAAGNEIGNHSHTHAHLIRRTEGESEENWKHRVTADIQQAQSLITKHTGPQPRLFSYPFGEHTAGLKSLVAQMGLFGVAQQSGAIGDGSDFLAVPRFPMATLHASLPRLATASRSRPLPVLSAEMQDNNYDYASAPIGITLALAEADYRLSQLACYGSDGNRLDMAGIPEDRARVFVNLEGQTRPGRNKINCTAPVINEKDAFYWYSHLWIKKLPDGSWYKD
jgi:peptidoglycan/xylan/chitin deacetylase (PgdA/CDA1 family)